MKKILSIVIPIYKVEKFITSVSGVKSSNFGAKKMMN